MRDGRRAGRLHDDVGVDLDQDDSASLAPGPYYLVEIAGDDDGRVAETDETDNAFVSATPQVQVKRADLVVAALSGPATGLVGKTIAVSNTIVRGRRRPPRCA